MNAEQIAQCQDAGNAAYALAQCAGESVTRCSDAYYVAYKAMEFAIETDAAPRANYIPHAVNTLDDIVPIADAMVYAFMAAQHDERGDGLAGNSANEYDSASEGRW